MTAVWLSTVLGVDIRFAGGGARSGEVKPLAG
jgi:hypothetical protein